VLLGVFAGIALLLAATGVYSVLSQAVARRTQEIGIRMALGARPAMIVRMVLRRGVTMAAIGVGVGLLSALALSHVLASLLYGVKALDPATFVAVPVVLAVVALLACVVPAGRAASVDPIVALRDE
jgi:ABC-type antimicrobial peptide transport system permease subunit